MLLFHSSVPMDGLSNVYAIFSIACIFIQLADGVNKLIKFLSAIQNAPARISAYFGRS